MALINRVTRLFRADMNAVLDRIEEPSIVLAQALREMEDNLHQDEMKLRLVSVEFKNIKFKSSSEQSNLQTLESEITLCIDAENESLAKNLIRKKLNLSKTIEQLKFKSDTLGSRIANLNDLIADKKQTLLEIQEKVELVTMDECDEASNFDSNVCSGFNNQSNSISDDDIEVEYLKLCNNKTPNSKKRKTA